MGVGLAPRLLALLVFAAPAGKSLATSSFVVPSVLEALFGDARELPSAEWMLCGLESPPIAPPHWVPHPSVIAAKKLLMLYPHILEVH